MSSLRLYLCGSVTGRSTKEMREERQAAAAVLREHGMVAVDPLAGEYEDLKGRRNIQDDQSGLSFANICLKDKYAIESSDMMLWLTADVASYGSCIEVGLAWALSKPIICVDAGGKGRRNAFVAHISTFVGESLEEAVEFIERYMMISDPSGEEEAVEGGE